MLLSGLQKCGLGVVLLMINLMPAKAVPQHEQSTQTTEHVNVLSITTVQYSEAWFIGEMARLQLQGDFGAHSQIGQLGLEFHPESVAIRLGLAHAAMSAGRCDWALSHLHALAGLLSDKVHHQMRQGIARICLGGWRQNAFTMGGGGRQKSLLGVSQKSTFKIEPGSPLHGICRFFANPCTDGRLQATDYGHTSGTDIWFGVLMKSWKPTFDGGKSLSLGLFRRAPTRSGFGGSNVVLRYWQSWQRVANRAVSMDITARTSHFGRGSKLDALSQSQIKLSLNRHSRTGPDRHRFAKYEQMLPWRWRLQTRLGLDHTIVMAAQHSRSTTMISYGLLAPLADYSLDLSVRLGQRTPANRTPRQMGFALSGHRIMIRGPGHWPVSVRAELDMETTKYQRRLPYLASAHSDRSRTFSLSIGRRFGVSDQLEIEITAKNNKISSRNTIATRSTKSVSLYFNYRFSN